MRLLFLAPFVFWLGCGAAIGDPPEDAGTPVVVDVGVRLDATPTDQGFLDGADSDSGVEPVDAGFPEDTGTPIDAGFPADTGVATDAGFPSGTPVFLVGGDGKALMTSTDGMNWTTVFSDNGVYVDLIRGVAGTEGLLVAVGGGNTTSQILVSTDGVTFEARSPGLNDWVGGAAFLGTDLIIVGGNGLRLRSTNQGQSFGNRGPYYEGHFRSVAAGGGLALAVGDTYGGQQVGLSSITSDGINWSPVRTGGALLYAVAYGNGRFVAVGEGGRCTSTADGITFDEHQCGNTPLYHVAYGDGHFVTSSGSVQYTSPDGITWTPDNVATPYRQVYANGLWVGVAGDGYRYHSSNGRTFTRGSGNRGPDRWISVGYLP